MKLSTLCRASIAPLAIGLALLSTHCASDTTDEDFSKRTVTAMQGSVTGDLGALIAAATELQASAPTPAGRGWDKSLDAADIAKMKEAWVKARIAYEHVEGALAPIFPDIDGSIDARYDDFLTNSGPDSNLFDDQGVTGLHAAERIIFSDVTPAGVIALEASLPGYKAAAFPSTEEEAHAFKGQLLARIVADAKLMKSQWTPAKIDLSGAFTGLADLMNEQREKVNKAGNQEEESRYAQRTMADLRANLEGTQKIYGVFRPWLLTKKSSQEPLDGPSHDKEILAGFAKLKAIYDTVDGDAFPAPPPGWSAEDPSEADLETPFGKLFVAVGTAVDPNQQGSLAQAMADAGAILGLNK